MALAVVDSDLVQVKLHGGGACCGSSSFLRRSYDGACCCSCSAGFPTWCQSCRVVTDSRCFTIFSTGQGQLKSRCEKYFDKFMKSQCRPQSHVNLQEWTEAITVLPLIREEWLDSLATRWKCHLLKCNGQGCALYCKRERVPYLPSFQSESLFTLPLQLCASFFLV